MTVRRVLRFDDFDAEPDVDILARTGWGDGVRVVEISKYMVALEGPQEAIDAVQAQLGSKWGSNAWSNARFELSGNPYTRVDFHPEASDQTRDRVAAARAYWPAPPPPDGPASYTFLFQPKRYIQARDIFGIIVAGGRIERLERRMVVVTGMRYRLLRMAYELGKDWVWHETGASPFPGPALGHPVPFPAEMVAVTLPPALDGSPAALPSVVDVQGPATVTTALRYRPHGSVPDEVWGIIESVAGVTVIERSVRMAVIKSQQVQVDALLGLLGDGWIALPVDTSIVYSTPAPPQCPSPASFGEPQED